MKTFLVKFRICVQVGPDDWEMRSKERLFPETTSLSEINEWALKNSGYETMPDKYKKMCEVQLSEPEKELSRT